jgi:hypothetical protein
VPIEVSCSKCGKDYRVPEERAGKRFRCADCQAIVTVPSSGVDEELEFDEPDVRTTNRRRMANAPPRAHSQRDSESHDGGSGSGGATLLWILGGIALLIIVACGGIG